MSRSKLKQLWEKWTIDRPAAFGDLMWQVLVVRLAAFLNRVTLRRVIAFIPVVVVVLAYAHSIPLPPEVMLVGDLLAYIDVFTVVFLVAAVSRVAPVMLLVKATARHAASAIGAIGEGLRRLDVRHRREAGGGARRTGQAGSRSGNDDHPAGIFDVAWA